MSTIAEREGFPFWAALQGFDLQGFDAWLGTIKGTGAHAELTERRAAAWAAIKANDEQAALRHLEWLLLRWRGIARVDWLLPLARKGDARAKQLGDFAAKANTARRKYSEADRVAWRALHAGDFAGHTDSNAARLIAQRLGLPKAAERSIRAALSKSWQPASNLPRG